MNTINSYILKFGEAVAENAQLTALPDLFPGDEPEKMVKKLTCVEYRPMRIPVFDKKGPLPRFD